MLKKIVSLALVFGVFVLGGCGDKTTPDPQELLRETFMNSFEINSSAFSTEVSLKIEDVEDSSGEFNFTLEGKVEDILEYEPKLDLTTNLEFSSKNIEDETSGDLSFSMKLIENTLFAKIGKIDFTSDDPQVEAIKPLFQMYSGKWWKFSLDMMKNDTINLEKQKTLQEEMLEAYKKLLSENDIFLAKNLSENDENYVLEVEPNFDLILTRDFIENKILPIAKNYIEKSEFTPEQKIETLKVLEIDDEKAEQITEIREIAKQVWISGNFKLIIEVDQDEIIQRSSKLSGSLDLAEINELMPEEEKEEGSEGKIVLSISSTTSDWNQSQNIVEPEEFIDFDPLMLFGNQMQEASFAPGNEEWNDYEEPNEMMNQEWNDSEVRALTEQEQAELETVKVSRPQ